MRAKWWDGRWGLGCGAVRCGRCSAVRLADGRLGGLGGGCRQSRESSAMDGWAIGIGTNQMAMALLESCCHVLDGIVRYRRSSAIVIDGGADGFFDTLPNGDLWAKLQYCTVMYSITVLQYYLCFNNGTVRSCDSTSI